MRNTNTNTTIEEEDVVHVNISFEIVKIVQWRSIETSITEMV